MPLPDHGEPKDSRSQETNWEIKFHKEFYAEFATWSEAVQDAVLSQLSKLRSSGLHSAGQVWTLSRDLTIPT